MFRHCDKANGAPYSMVRLFLLLTFWAGAAAAGTTDDSVKRIVNDSASSLISTFKQFHENPELGFQEFATAETIAAHLKKLGYPVKTGVGGTGVVSVLKNGPGPVVLFRSDMDALPVKELVELDYASTKVVENLEGVTVPVMHACGHDAHSAWLMGVASVMMALREQWSGTLILVAQPAEELLSGAQAMVGDAVMQDLPPVDYVIAGHQFPIWPVGSVALVEGYRMAGSIQMDVVISGKGGHGSTPHMAIDPIVMGSQAVMAYQAIVARMVDQSKPAVLTVGAFQAGLANNVIPDSATLKLNLRWYDPSVKEGMVNGIKAVTDNIAKTWGVSADSMPTYTIKSDVPPVSNDQKLVDRASVAMREILGEKAVLVAGPAYMGSEDFHLLAGNNVSASILMVEVGSGPVDVFDQMKEGRMPAFPHNPNFYMEPDTVLVGSEAFSAVLLDLLRK